MRSEASPSISRVIADKDIGLICLHSICIEPPARKHLDDFPQTKQANFLLTFYASIYAKRLFAIRNKSCQGDESIRHTLSNGGGSSLQRRVLDEEEEGEEKLQSIGEIRCSPMFGIVGYPVVVANPIWKVQPVIYEVLLMDSGSIYHT